MSASQPPSDRDGRAASGPALLALVAVVVIGLAATGEEGRLLARYDRADLAAGQYWRLVAGHLAHLGWGHAVLNLVALGLVVAAFGGLFSPWRWLLVGLGSAFAVDAGLWLFEPAVGWYVGLSGVLHGLVAAAAVALLARSPRLGMAILAILAAKLLWEGMAGGLPFTAGLAGGPVVTEAHFWGAAGGAATALVLALLPDRRPTV